MEEKFAIVKLEKTNRRFVLANALAALLVQTVTDMPGGYKVKGGLDDNMFRSGKVDDYLKILGKYCSKCGNKNG